MSAQDILKECSELLTERDKVYGDFDHSMANFAELTRLFLSPSQSCKTSANATALMVALKLSRMVSPIKQASRDTCIDLINYMAQYVHLMDKQEGW